MTSEQKTKLNGATKRMELVFEKIRRRVHFEVNDRNHFSTEHFQTLLDEDLFGIIDDLHSMLPCSEEEYEDLTDEEYEKYEYEEIAKWKKIEAEVEKKN